MELENVLKLINAVSKSELTSFTLEDGDTKLSFGADRPDKYNNTLNKSDITSVNAISAGNEQAVNRLTGDRLSYKEQAVNRFVDDRLSENQLSSNGLADDSLAGNELLSDKQVINSLADDKLTASEPDNNSQTVTSPLVGIFYSAESPEAKDYVAVGDTVKKGQVIGIIEAMKLMNEIQSDYDGVVTKILVDNEQLVEYGQPMFVIKPA